MKYSKKFIAIFLCISLLLCACQSKEIQETTTMPTKENTAPNVEVAHPEPMEKDEETGILETVFFADWSDDEYIIVSADISAENSQWRIHSFDNNLKLKDTVSISNMDELGKKLPDGVIVADFAGQNERKLHSANSGWDAKSIDENMGERYSLSPDLLTLCYNSPDKSKLIVEKYDGNKISYDFPGLVDLKCMNNNLVYLETLAADHQNTTIIFDFIKGEVLAELPASYSSYEVVSCDAFAILHPSAGNGNVDDPVYCYDFTNNELSEIQLSEETHNLNIRLSSNGNYAVAGSGDKLSIYKTDDFSIAAVAELGENYDFYENSISQTVSDDGSVVLIHGKGDLIKRIETKAVFGLI